MAATQEMARAELERSSRFGSLLGAAIPAEWPPPLNDEGSMTWFLQLMERADYSAGWATWYWILEGEEPTAVGNGGFKGPPGRDGVVEVGYSLLAGYEGRGLASEAIAAMVRWAFSHPEVTAVVAHTLPDLARSIRLLQTAGFSEAGAGAEPGTILYVLSRSEFVKLLPRASS